MTEPASTAAAKPRFIDTRIPVTWLLGIAGGAIWALVTMYFTLNQLVTTVADLSAAVKASTESANNVQSKLAVIEFRLGNVENQVDQIVRGKSK